MYYVYVVYTYTHDLFNDHAESNYLTSDTTAIRQQQKIQRGKQYTNNRNAEDILYIYTYILYKYLVIDLIVVLCLDSGLNSTKCPPLLSISIYIYLSVLVDLSNSLS